MINNLKTAIARVETAATPQEAADFIAKMAQKYLDGNATAKVSTESGNSIILKAKMPTNKNVDIALQMGGAKGEVYVDIVSGPIVPKEFYSRNFQDLSVKGKKSISQLLTNSSQEQTDITKAIQALKDYREDSLALTKFLVAVNKEFAKAAGK